jgi:transposase
VFLDESGAKTNMTRLHARAPRGERVVEHTPHGHWHTTTMISAIRLSGVIAPMVIDGPMDSLVFRGYVERVLSPMLCRGDIVVMDNLGSHKTAGVQEAIDAVGACLCYLPPYSPDFNPIEPMWSKVKRIVRSCAARTSRSLLGAIGKGLRTVTPTDCRGFFRGCGYAAT